MKAKILNRFSKSKFTQKFIPATREGSYINRDYINLRVKTRNPLAETFTETVKKLSQINSRIHSFEHSIDPRDWKSNFLKVFVQVGNLKEKQEFLNEIKKLDIEISQEIPEKVPNFPIEINDLDKWTLEEEHPIDYGLLPSDPEFSDKVYYQRRLEVGELSKGYKMGTPIPHVKYTEEEIKLWKDMYIAIRPSLLKHSSGNFVKNFLMCEKEGIMNENFIPQLEVVNEYLYSKSQFRMKPVNGIVLQRDYFNGLAFRTFPAAQYMRHPSKTLFTPDPDIFHEIVGHVPTFCDKRFCDMAQEMGILSLGAEDNVIKILTNIYYFTLEYGMIKENGEIKCSGAGLTSELGEIENSLKCKDIRKLDVLKDIYGQELGMQNNQEYYYYLEDIDEGLGDIQKFIRSLKKPFRVSVNDDSTKIFVDREIETYHKEPVRLKKD